MTEKHHPDAVFIDDLMLKLSVEHVSKMILSLISDSSIVHNILV